MSKKTHIFIMSLAFVGAVDVSLAQTKKVIANRAQDQDLCLSVNDGGTPTDAVCLEGNTSKVEIPQGSLKVGDKDELSGSNAVLVVGSSGASSRSAIEINGNTANAHGVIFFYNNDVLNAAIESRGSDRLNFTNATRFGFGTSTPDTFLHVKSSVANDARIKLDDGGTKQTTIGYVGLGSDLGIDFSNGVQFRDQNAGYATRMRINSVGQLITNDGTEAAPAHSFINDPDMGMYRCASNELCITSSGARNFRIHPSSVIIGPYTGGVSHRFIVSVPNTAGGTAHAQFIDGNAQQNGAVNCNATSLTCSYVTTSDGRLKHKHSDFSGIDMVMRMKPSMYERKNNPGIKEYGFVAQELYDVLPQAVSVGGEDTKSEPWSIDYGKPTAVLAKAIQELVEQNRKLEAEIKELKNGYR